MFPNLLAALGFEQNHIEVVLNAGEIFSIRGKVAFHAVMVEHEFTNNYGLLLFDAPLFKAHVIAAKKNELSIG